MTVNTAKKGITAVVAIVLLLMMTVAAAGLAYMWISQMQTSAQETGTQQVSAISQQAQTSYSIDSVRGSGGNLVVDIRNTGQSVLQITSATATQTKYYVDGNSTAGMGIPANTAIGINNASSFALTGAQAAMPAIGVRKSVRIITPNGFAIDFSCRATSTTRCEGY